MRFLAPYLSGQSKNPLKFRGFSRKLVIRWALKPLQSLSEGEAVLRLAG
jgi:hypothetical protein